MRRGRLPHRRRGGPRAVPPDGRSTSTRRGHAGTPARRANGGIIEEPVTRLSGCLSGRLKAAPHQRLRVLRTLRVLRGSSHGDYPRLIRPSAFGLPLQCLAVPEITCICSSPTTLLHVSENGGIERFEPRDIDGTSERLVWAIDDDRLRNYLVPRECPRVTYYARVDTSKEDVDRFLGSSTAVLAVEHAWLARLRSARLYCYQLPPDTFEPRDSCAGYFVSHAPVVPRDVRVIDDCLSELIDRGVEVRVMSNLWHLRDAVVSSTLQFSIIRMRNALPRTAAPDASVTFPDSGL